MLLLRRYTFSVGACVATARCAAPSLGRALIEIRNRMKMSSPLLDYCGRVEIIHLPDRIDRYWRLARELADLGIAMTDQRVRIPHAPRPDDTNGFPSRGVYGNFLSHLDILRRAAKDDLQAAWVLEDDAIFRTSFRSFDVQKKMCDQLAMASWDLCFLGHTISKELSDRPVGLIPCELSFRWSHCYLVNKRFIPELVKYLEATLERPAGHPEGGRLFIDGAFNLIRELRPEIRTLVFNPTLSIQAGSQSSLNPEIWYDGIQSLHWLAERSRSVRDDIWRRTGFHWPGHEIRR